jgi:hypothetical protein
LTFSNDPLCLPEARRRLRKRIVLFLPSSGPKKKKHEFAGDRERKLGKKSGRIDRS